MKCQWCYKDIENDNQEPVQFCSDDCKIMHPFGAMLDEINTTINSGRDKDEVLLLLNRTGRLVEPEPTPEPEPVPSPPTDEFDR